MVPGKGISMQDKKQNKIKLQIIFSILIFTVVLIADFYAMINFSKEYLLIAAITVILLICLWGVLNGIFSLRALKDQRSEEQYDSVFKSEKASYLMLKKYFEEIEEKIDILQKSSKVPTEEIINAQKAIAKVVINRNRENADAIMGSNEQLMETIAEYENKIKEGNDFIIESQKNVLYENLKEISEKQQLLSDSIKEMEIRLSQAIAANPVQFTANVEMPKGMAVAADDSNTFIPVEPAATAEIPESEAEVQEITEPENVTEPVENMPEHDIMDDISIKVPDNMEAQSTEPEPVIEPVQEEQPVVEPVIEPAPVEDKPVAEEQKVAEVPKAPEVDTSDPNRQLNPDEIAALFAGMQGDSADTAKEEQSVEEPASSPVEQQVVEQPKTPEIDTSDPNRQLSPDEIAALFAGAQGGAAESVKEEQPAAETPVPVEEKPKETETPKAPQVDMSDPNRNLTPDEIAALIGNL